MTFIDSASENELERLVRQAGAHVLRYWPGGAGNSRAELEINKKVDGSLVTTADLESNEILIRGLHALFPQDSIYSEEIADEGTSDKSSRVWIIDPLDGTKSFVDGNDDFSILLSLCVDEQIVFGAMYFPARNVYARAARGRGAALEGESLHVSSAAAFRRRAIYLRHLPLPADVCFYDRWMDSGMAFLSLCRGELDGIVVRLIHHQEWDLAAPAVMIAESGGRVTDEHGNPVRFKTHPVDYGYFIASNGVIHSQLLQLLPKP